jgi:tRNA(fMet)-specific endonuclease VapC
MFLLDTDTCIEVIREREPTLSRVRSMSPDDLAVSAMTVAELYYGALNSQRPEPALARVRAFLSAPLAMHDFGFDAARHHAEIRLALRSQPIGERDLVIAATARAADLTVVTRNRRHFERVPGLHVENWTADDPR